MLVFVFIVNAPYHSSGHKAHLQPSPGLLAQRPSASAHVHTVEWTCTLLCPNRAHCTNAQSLLRCWCRLKRGTGLCKRRGVHTERCVVCSQAGKAAAVATAADVCLSLELPAAALQLFFQDNSEATSVFERMQTRRRCCTMRVKESFQHSSFAGSSLQHIILLSRLQSTNSSGSELDKSENYSGAPAWLFYNNICCILYKALGEGLQ